ncbi:hypothetical protein PHMEG_0009766 [Phytophthora megakarya]|uniref:Uncharacterized protein n=1 Tax=Phytophthora megakarya TaxID=4795 RepID=A0A225WGA3_9STRA|nr:hypothetical protein PHMEG_0009766 [Phytophthora megakarya]
MIKYVTELMDSYERRQRELDGETGQEHDLTPIEELVRNRLEEMTQNRRDFILQKNANTNKRRREEGLQREGFQLRENAARAMVGGALTEIGGSAFELGSNGQVEQQQTTDDHTTECLGTHARRRRRRNPQHQQAITDLAEKENQDRRERDHLMLAFEREKLAQDAMLRREELEVKREKMSLRAQESAREHDLELRKIDIKQDAHNSQVQIKLRELDILIKRMN